MKDLAMFGLNQATISSVGVMVCGIIGAYGQWRQARLIWRAKSAQSVSIYWTFSFLFMFLAYLVEGLNSEKGVMAIQGGLRAVFYLPIIIGIAVFAAERISRRSKIFCAILALGIAAMIFLPEWSGLLFLCYGYLGVFVALDQPLQIWKNRSRGKVSITMLATYTAAVSFWTWYAWVFNDLRLFWVSAVFAAEYIVTMVLWFKYKHGQ